MAYALKKLSLLPVDQFSIDIENIYYHYGVWR